MKGGKATRQKVRGGILKAFEAELKELKQHPTKSKGYYPLISKSGGGENLKVLRVREGHFHSRIPP